MKKKINRKNATGTALLVVLFVIMAITILSLGFLSRSDVELACGANMILRAKMDYLAESGLEHARGLILNSNNLSESNWRFSDWLYDANDCYDVDVVKLGECNYKITCDAYRKKDGVKIGHSSLETELRLDPCIAFWSQIGTTISNNVIINGDVYCNGTLTSNGIINGDVFAGNLAGSGSVKGRRKTTGDLNLLWPQIAAGDYSPDQAVEANSIGVSNLSGVIYCPNDIELSGDVNIAGVLIVDGNLTITGIGNVITAGENLPAMLVNGNLTIEAGSNLDVYGLAVVKGGTQVFGSTSITGGLFVENGIMGDGDINITAAPSRTVITTWPSEGNPARWVQAAGAFFKSIKRN